MNVREELIEEYKEGNVFKKALLIVIGIVFGLVAVFLTLCAKVFHVTYNTVNVVAYYFLIPLSWTILFDRGLSLPYTTTLLYTGVWIGIVFMSFGHFQEWCDRAFGRSVDFLLWFKRIGWNYHVASVIICVVVPIAIYAALIMLNIEHPKHKVSNKPTQSETIASIEENNITIEEKEGLRIYFPNYNKIDLVCETMPSPDDESVLMCCEAAFTGELLNEFKHSNIAGNHVSGGVFYKGYRCKANTGCFAYYADNGTWEFAIDDYTHCLNKAVEHKGATFGQAMIIHNRKDVHNGRPCKDTSKNQYRALCELDGKLCIIDAKAAMPYKDFIQSLLKAGVKYAIYLDMGSGWNYSYYRGNDGKVHYIHKRRIKYTTNWITFYKKGKIDPKKLRPITYDPVHHKYIELGEVVGNAFCDGKELK